MRVIEKKRSGLLSGFEAKFRVFSGKNRLNNFCVEIP